MNFDIEEAFVNNFIAVSYRDRIMYELRSPKKRKNALTRFSHNTETLISKKNVVSILKSLDNSVLTPFLCDQVFYVISYKYLDGVLMNVDEMISYINDEYSPVIVCGKDTAIIKKEHEQGATNYYLLKQR